MTTLTKENQTLLVKELSNALIKFSQEKLSPVLANKVATLAVENVDFTNSALAHKGINWYAKDLLKRINY
ncbi:MULTISPECIES: hypothetical protein [Paenibacillus]|uniref:hypothetical protein n=1 Tax=Paenibacillus TaxID=44249 RepID=UPI00203E5F5B|nr:hypothetical protein [Paenibacillus camelliae]MCM3633981.1 hypothetical protein [Paenibacillus camelliae]